MLSRCCSITGRRCSIRPGALILGRLVGLFNPSRCLEDRSRLITRPIIGLMLRADCSTFGSGVLRQVQKGHPALHNRHRRGEGGLRYDEQRLEICWTRRDIRFGGCYGPGRQCVNTPSPATARMYACRIAGRSRNQSDLPIKDRAQLVAACSAQKWASSTWH